MKVILTEDVKNVGKTGAVVSVADGYARNFLLPKGLAVTADTKSIRALEHQKRVIEQRTKKLLREANAVAERLSEIKITLKARAGEEEKLFGSVTTMDIADELKAQGVEVERKKILLDEPIKRLGSYEVGVRVSPEVTAMLKVEVIAE